MNEYMNFYRLNALEKINDAVIHTFDRCTELLGSDIEHMDVDENINTLINEEGKGGVGYKLSIINSIRWEVQKSNLLVEMLQHIEKEYAEPPALRYRGNKRPNEQRVFAEKLTDWFRKCIGKPEADICNQTVEAILLSRDSNYPLIKHPNR